MLYPAIANSKAMASPILALTRYYCYLVQFMSNKVQQIIKVSKEVLWNLLFLMMYCIWNDNVIRKSSAMGLGNY